MGRVELSQLDVVVEVAADVRFELYRDWSREELLCHPTDAIRLCNEVRARTGLGWTDRDILWTLFPPSRRPFGPM